MMSEAMSTQQSFHPLSDGYYIAQVVTDEGTDFWLCRVGEDAVVYLSDSWEQALDAARRYIGVH